MTAPSNKKKQFLIEQSCNGKRKWRLEQRIASQPDNCTQVIELLLAQLETFEWGNRDSFGIHMAMEEAVMNAIRHGNQCDQDKEVLVVIQIDNHQFYAQITDEGDGFDPDSVPDPTLEENVEKSSGRGVMLIKNFVDRVQYNAKGNSVELEKTKTLSSDK